MKELSLTLKTPATQEPISRKEAKAHIRVDDDFTTDDSLIDALIKAARSAAEHYTRRQFITATYELRLDYFPSEINPPRPPLQSVVSIKYTDTDQAEQTLDSAKYVVDPYSTVGRIVPAVGESWPSLGSGINKVTIEYVAGYGDDGEDVEEDVRSAMLLTIGHLYEHREDVVIGTIVTKLAKGADLLLWPHRIIGV